VKGGRWGGVGVGRLGQMDGNNGENWGIWGRDVGQFMAMDYVFFPLSLSSFPSFLSSCGPVLVVSVGCCGGGG